jgi:hypothetical protein
VLGSLGKRRLKGEEEAELCGSFFLPDELQSHYGGYMTYLCHF